MKAPQQSGCLLCAVFKWTWDRIPYRPPCIGRLCALYFVLGWLWGLLILSIGAAAAGLR